VSVSYGEKRSAPIVSLTQRDSSACFLTAVYPYKGDEPSVCIEMQEPTVGPWALLLDEQASVRITVTRNGEQYHDNLLFTDQPVLYAATPDAPSPTHIRVSRSDKNGRLLFQHEA